MHSHLRLKKVQSEQPQGSRADFKHDDMQAPPRLGNRGSDVGSSGGSGASESSLARLAQPQLPPRAPEPSRPHGEPKPFLAASTWTMPLPPAPPQPPNIPCILPTQGGSPPRHNTRRVIS